MKKTLLFISVFLFVLPGLACNFSAGKQPITPTPVETDACCLDQPVEIQATLEAGQVETTPAQPTPLAVTPTLGELAPVQPVSGVEPGWYAYTNPNVVRDLVVYQGVIYAATLGGMVSWRLDSGSYTRYTTLDGMRHVSAYSIAVCDVSQPRILVGTLNGISLFDPSTGLWEQDTPESWEDWFGGRKIERLFCDQANRRLLIGYSGLGVLDLETGDFQHYTMQEGLLWDAVTDITVHGQDIWVASGYKGLAKVSNNQVVTYSNQNGLPDDRVSALAFDSNGTLWAGAASGIISFVNGNWSLHDEDPSVGLADINEIEIGQDGKIWVATAALGGGRLCQFDPETGSCTEDYEDGNHQAILALGQTEAGLPVYGTSSGIVTVAKDAASLYQTDDLLASNYVDALTVDPEGRLWIGTDSGIHIIDPANPSGDWQTFRQSETPGIGGGWASAIAFGPDHSAWTTIINGSASHYKNGEWTALPDVYSFNSVDVDDDGQVWFGDDGKGLVVLAADGSLKMKLTTKEGLPGDNVQAVLVDQANTVWLGTDKGLARYADGALEVIFGQDQPGLPNNYIRALALDADGGLIIGTFTGVARYDGNRIETLVDFLTSGFRQARLTTLAVAPTGRIWVGTDHGLLFSDDYANWTMLTTQDGLLTDTVSALVVDPYGAAWVGGGGSNFDGGGLLQIVP